MLDMSQFTKDVIFSTGSVINVLVTVYVYYLCVCIIEVQCLNRAICSQGIFQNDRDSWTLVILKCTFGIPGGEARELGSVKILYAKLAGL